MPNDKKYFFGWTNIKWIITEFVKIYTNKPSIFSKKRIESGIAFITLEIGAFTTLFNGTVKTMQDFAIWCGLLQPIIFYTVYKIQEEKKNDPT